MGLFKSIICFILVVSLNELQSSSAENFLGGIIDDSGPAVISRIGRHFLIAIKASPVGARSLCKNNNAELVSIEDEDEDIIVKALLLAQSSPGGWTSGRAFTSGNFEWTSTNQLLTSNGYKDFETEPNYATRTGCIYLTRDILTSAYTWKIDDQCNSKYHVICEKPL